MPVTKGFRHDAARNEVNCFSYCGMILFRFGDGLFRPPHLLSQTRKSFPSTSKITPPLTHPMSAKLKKIDKEFQLTDSSVNCYGFRLLTEGYLLAEYEKNPIGYYMHNREDGVVLRWEDFRIDGDKVFAKPVINMSHERAEQTVAEIENGFLNAASVGHIITLEYSDEPKMKLPGQQGPTITKWFNRECSLVDIPGNYDSLALYDADENPINLADFTSLNLNTPMSKTILALTAVTLAALNLKPESTQEDADKAIVDLAANLNAEKIKVKQLETEKTGLQKSIDGLKAETVKKEVTDQLAAALKSGQITVALQTVLAAQYDGKPEELKTVLSAIPGYKPIADQLTDKGGSGSDPFAGKTYKELHKEGKVADLKAKNPELYKELFHQEYGKYPKGV